MTYIPVALSFLALTVSFFAFLQTHTFNRKKAARDLWQKNLELYLAHPAHLLGRPEDGTEEKEQAYRIHVAFVLLALEEILKAFGNDASWNAIVRRHLTRHKNYIREILADRDRLSTYAPALQKKMKVAI